MQKYEYVYKTPNKHTTRKKTARLIKFIYSSLSLIFIIFICIVIFKGIKENVFEKQVLSPVAKSITASVASIAKIIFPERLKNVVLDQLKDADGDYAVSIKNLKTGESYELNGDKVFKTASLYKLWVMATVMQKIEKRQMDPDKVLVKDIASLNKSFGIATESAELKEGTLEIDVGRAVNQMIVVSNNYAALSLMQEVGVGTVSAFLKNNGFNFSKTGNPPTSTALDIRLFYEDLYKGKFANKETTQKMLDILKNQEINDRIPKYLPEKIEIGHKTGELDGYKHDAGIVYAPKGDYVIVVMSNTKDPQVAVDVIAKISKAVYEHFEKE